MGSNQVRQRREALGLSQVTLAEAADLTRQSVGAIEAARSVPGVDVALRLARALDCKVEDLFATEPEVLQVECGPGVGQGRVALAHVAGRWVAYAQRYHALPSSADGILVRAQRGRGQVELLRGAAELQDNVVLMGCAAGLGVLADRLNARPGPGRFHWVACSSTRALEALGRAQTHVAGVHLVDSRSGEVNVADVRRHASAVALTLITLGTWDVGLVLAPGNPKKIRTVADLGRRGLRVVTREPGSGARRVWDRLVQDAAVHEVVNRAASLQVNGHLELASLIALGAADVGLATRDAAIAFELEFVPLLQERYDLAVPSDAAHEPRFARLLDALTSVSLRRELSSLGYDMGAAGQRAAELPAA